MQAYSLAGDMRRAEVLFDYLTKLSTVTADDNHNGSVSTSLSSSARRMSVMAYHHLMEGYRRQEDIDNMVKLANTYRSFAKNA
jgi:hypothetical protein